MNENAASETLGKIKRTHERVALIAGVIMAVAISSYFFTFSDLLNSGASGWVWFEIVSLVLFVFGLIFLKRLALFITRLILSGDDECRRVLKDLTLHDLDRASAG